MASRHALCYDRFVLIGRGRQSACVSVGLACSYTGNSSTELRGARPIHLVDRSAL